MSGRPARSAPGAVEMDAASLDFAAILRPGDRVVSGQMAGEPRTLTETLVAQRASLPQIDIFLGVQQSETFTSETAGHLRFSSFGAMEKTGLLARGDRLDIIPQSLCSLGRALTDGTMGCDVLLLQCAPGRSGEDALSFSVTNDYLQAAMRRARVVLAEVNDQAPWTFNDAPVDPSAVDIIVHSSRPLPHAPTAIAGETEQAIAEHCAHFIEDGSCIQVGIGAVPERLLSRLSDRRDLGFHGGLISDGAARLIDHGVITNSQKPHDKGWSVAAMASGSAWFYRFLDHNPSIRICSSLYTHAQAVIAGIDRFVAINSALEVDLFGAVNSEAINGRWIGGVGGLPDFVSGALAAPRGRSIIALPAATPRGDRSRIVARLNGPTTIPRTHADIVVTQYGRAELRGQSLRERARRMIAIADPAFRDALADDLKRTDGL